MTYMLIGLWFILAELIQFIVLMIQLCLYSTYYWFMVDNYQISKITGSYDLLGKITVESYALELSDTMWKLVENAKNFKN